MTSVTALVPEVFYNYVTDGSRPADATEGETLYDTQADESMVYNGTGWDQINVSAHGDLSGIGASDHHSRYTDAEAEAAAPVQSVNGSGGDVSLGVELLSERKSLSNYHDHGASTAVSEDASASGMLWSMEVEGKGGSLGNLQGEVRAIAVYEDGSQDSIKVDYCGSSTCTNSREYPSWTLSKTVDKLRLENDATDEYDGGADGKLKAVLMQPELIL